MVIAKITNSKYYIILGILLICLYIYPYIILGQDSMLRIHDTLDSVMPNMVAVAHSRQAFKLDGVINNIMNGLSRSSFVSPFYVVQWLFIFFHPFTAFVINAFIVHLIAFIGMFLLLKNHFLQSEENTFIAFGCALCFAIIPHMQLFGLSVAGTPLLLYAFLNLFNTKKYFVSYSIILFFPFYSSVVLSGIFIICGVMLLFAADCFINKHLNKQVLIGMLILVAGYALTEYRLISDIFLNSAFVTHRVEWNVYKASFGFKAAVTTALSNFIYEDKHAYDLHTLILVFSTIASISISLKNNFSREYKTKLLIPILITLSTWLFLWFFILNGVMPATAITEIDTALQTFPILSQVAIFIHKYLFFILVLCSVLLISTIIVTLIPSKSKIFLEKNSKLLFILVLIAFIISLFYGFYRWDGLIPLKEKIPFLVTFKMNRFYFLHPIVWYLIFALSLSIIHKLKYGKYLVLFLVVCQIYYLYINNNDYNNQLQYNIKAVYCKIKGINFDSSYLTYRKFFSENLYNNILSQVERYS